MRQIVWESEHSPESRKRYGVESPNITQHTQRNALFLFGLFPHSQFNGCAWVATVCFIPFFFSTSVDFELSGTLNHAVRLKKKEEYIQIQPIFIHLPDWTNERTPFTKAYILNIQRTNPFIHNTVAAYKTWDSHIRRRRRRRNQNRQPIDVVLFYGFQSYTKNHRLFIKHRPWSMIRSPTTSYKLKPNCVRPCVSGMWSLKQTKSEKQKRED